MRLSIRRRDLMIASEELFEKVGNITPSRSSLGRLPRKLSERWEADRAGFETTLREAMVIPEEAVSVAVSLDGVLGFRYARSPRSTASIRSGCTRGVVESP